MRRSFFRRLLTHMSSEDDSDDTLNEDGDEQSSSEGVAEENQVSPVVKSKDLVVDEDVGWTRGVQEGPSGYKRKRELSDTDMMDTVMTQMGELSRLTLDERLMAMSVIGRSAPLAKMFDRLDVDGKVRMAQMVANGSIR